MTRRRVLAATTLATVGGSFGTSTVSSSGWSVADENVTLVVPYPPTHPTDTLGRTVAEASAAAMEGSIDVENVPGREGVVGTGAVYGAEPDGQTLVALDLPATATAWYVQQSDFGLLEMMPVATLGSVATVVYANPDYEIAGFDDLVDRYEDGEVTTIGGTPIGTVVDRIAWLLRIDSPLLWETYVAYEDDDAVTEAVIADEVPIGIGVDVTLEPAVEEDLLDPVVSLTRAGSDAFPDLEAFDRGGEANEEKSNEDESNDASAGTVLDAIDVLSRRFTVVLAPPETPDETVVTIGEWIETGMEGESIQAVDEESGIDVEYGDAGETRTLVDAVSETVRDVVDFDDVWVAGSG